MISVMPDTTRREVLAAHRQTYNRLRLGVGCASFLILANVFSAGPIWGQKLLQKAAPSPPAQAVL